MKTWRPAGGLQRIRNVQEMRSGVSNWTGKLELNFLGLPYALFSTNGLENSRKILAVSTQLKQLRKESLKFFSGFLFAAA